MTIAIFVSSFLKSTDSEAGLSELSITYYYSNKGTRMQFLSQKGLPHLLSIVHLYNMLFLAIITRCAPFLLRIIFYTAINKSIMLDSFITNNKNWVFDDDFLKKNR